LLPLLRLPVQATDDRERETALSWLGRQFLVYQREVTRIRREVRQKLLHAASERTAAMELLAGSYDGAIDMLVRSQWRSSKRPDHRFPALASITDRLLRQYGIASATFFEESLSGLAWSPAARFVLVLDFYDPSRLNFYVLKRSDAILGGDFAPQPREVLAKALFRTEITRYQHLLHLWDETTANTEEELLELGLREAAERQRIDDAKRSRQSVTNLWRDEPLTEAITIRLVESTIGVSPGEAIVGLAAYDACSEVERWARASFRPQPVEQAASIRLPSQQGDPSPPGAAREQSAAQMTGRPLSPDGPPSS
jgi:hypothetical protein